MKTSEFQQSFEIKANANGNKLVCRNARSKAHYEYGGRRVVQSTFDHVPARVKSMLVNSDK